MNIAYKAFARTYQKIMWVATLAMRFRIPKTLDGEGCLEKVPDFIKENEPHVKKVLVVTDKVLMGTGLLNPLFASFEQAGLEYALYDGVVPNPTVQNIEEATNIYKENGCQALFAFGGGSSMDCAKGVGVRIARPNTPLRKMRGVMKVNKKIPPLFAIPTTAGTGSETTVAAIISDGNYKYSVMDPVLIPKYAILDPLVTVGLPKHVTSTTGMDALSHAVEAFVGINHNKLTDDYAIRAIQSIFVNLKKAYDNGKDIEVRKNMQIAAYEAGISFTRTNVGDIHAIAHALGGQFHLPHGLAIAVTMPHVLRYYGETAYARLAVLADAVGLTGNNEEEKAKAFIAAIDELNAYMGIPATLNGYKLGEREIKIAEEDVAVMTGNAVKEANPLYPVPKMMDVENFAELFRTVAGMK